MRSHGGVRAQTVIYIYICVCVCVYVLYIYICMYIGIYIYMAMVQRCSEHEQLMGQMLSPDAFFVFVSCS